MFPTNDYERLYVIFMINIGDILFALAFGLIAAIWMHFSQSDEVHSFIGRMAKVDEFLNSFNVDKSQRKRVEQYFCLCLSLENKH